MTDRDEVIELVHRHAQLTDDGNFEARADLYTEDADFLGWNRQPDHGRDAIREAFRSLTPALRIGKHITSNAVVEIDGAQATAQTDFVFFRMSPEGVSAMSIGRYFDRFAKVADGWRFTRREITAIEPSDAVGP